MLISSHSKTELLEFVLGSHGTPEKISFKSSKRAIDALMADSMISALWSSDEASEPSSFLVEDMHLQETIAFLATYANPIGPVTSFYRIAPKSFFIDSGEFKRKREERRELTSAFIGIIIAEAFIQTGSLAKSPAHISNEECFSTLSACILQAYAQGHDLQTIKDLTRRWSTAQSIVSHSQQMIPPDAILSFWSVIIESMEDLKGRNSDIDRSRNELSRVIREIFQERSFSSRAWARLTSSHQALMDAYGGLIGSKEDRIKAFDDVVRSLSRTANMPPLQRDLLLGIAASQVAGGSLSYITLANEALRNHPMAVLWFFLLTSLHPKTDLMVAGNSLGRHISDKLLSQESLSSKTRADISFEEFLMYASENRANLSIRSENSSVLVIELMPLIYAKFRQPSTMITAPQEGLYISERKQDEIRALLHYLNGLLFDEKSKGQKELSFSHQSRGGRRNKV